MRNNGDNLIVEVLNMNKQDLSTEEYNKYMDQYLEDMRHFYRLTKNFILVDYMTFDEWLSCELLNKL